MVKVYVLDVPEFEPLVLSVRDTPNVTIVTTGQGYTVIEAPVEIEFDRKLMRMKPAVWYGAFTGGLDGKISHFGRDKVHVVNASELV